MEKTTRALTCIVCPRGCQMQVTLEDGVPVSVCGNICPRGKTYAEAECTHPVRTLTSTIRLQDGRILPVKTNGAIPKHLLFDAMDIVGGLHPAAPVALGQVILQNLLDTGVDVVATADAE
ncbi:MAG: DUF1667 domain-containing protein [Clostridia bacterium]|nr:DUF1667 domain-containing protein [Clostridia bacterium]